MYKSAKRDNAWAPKITGVFEVPRLNYIALGINFTF